MEPKGSIFPAQGTVWGGGSRDAEFVVKLITGKVFGSSHKSE